MGDYEGKTGNSPELAGQNRNSQGQPCPTGSSPERACPTENFRELAGRTEAMPDYEHQAKYYETDQMGIIHHSNYIRWMEEARMEYLSVIGFPMEKIEALGIVSPVVSVSCEYKRSTRLNERICIHVEIQSYNGVKLVLSYRMYEKESGELRALGTSSHCFTTRDGKLLSLKKKYPELHAALCGEEVQ